MPRFIRLLSVIASLFLGACSHEQYFSGPQTAQSYYGALKSNSQRQVFGAGYNFGSQDAMQRMVKSEDRAMRYDVPGYQSNASKLRTSTVAIPVPGYVDNSGVIHDQSIQYVRTVQ